MRPTIHRPSSSGHGIGGGRRGDRRTWGALALAPVATMSLVACGSLPGGGADDGPVPVTFVASDWAGERDHSPTPVTTETEATKGESITAEGEYDDVDVTFTSVTEDEVAFDTSEPMAPKGDEGRINLDDTRTSFTVERGTRLEFSTPSMDSGTTWVVTIEEPTSS